MELSQRRRQVLGRLRHRKTREREGLVLVEGIRAAGEALAAGAVPAFAVTSPRLDALAGGAELVSALRGSGVDVAHVDDAALTELGDTEHPQGVLLVCREPSWSADDVVAPGRRYLVLDGVQDPGNVGTLLRAATAFALDGVLALDGTCDPWSAKAVRSSAGMAFRVPVLRLGAPEALSLLGAAGVPVLVADAGGADVAGVDGSGGWALVVGNEGSGPRDAVRQGSVAIVRIPMPGPAESLNAAVAASILLYALTRR